MKKKQKNEKIGLNFASLCFASKQKLLNRSEAKNVKRKNEKMQKIAKKREKNEKKRKNRLEFRFALFHFEAKIIQVKRSENKRIQAKKEK